MAIRNGTLYLVTGCDKARSWSTKRYAHSSSASTFALARIFHYRKERHLVSGVDERSHEREMTPDARANQTIFLRGYSISVRTKNWMLGNRVGVILSLSLDAKYDHRMCFPTNIAVSGRVRSTLTADHRRQ